MIPEVIGYNSEGGGRIKKKGPQVIVITCGPFVKHPVVVSNTTDRA